MRVQIGPYTESCGVHTGRVKGVDLYFLHHPGVFPACVGYSHLEQRGRSEGARTELTCGARLVSVFQAVPRW